MSINFQFQSKPLEVKKVWKLKMLYLMRKLKKVKCNFWKTLF